MKAQDQIKPIFQICYSSMNFLSRTAGVFEFRLRLCGNPNRWRMTPRTSERCAASGRRDQISSPANSALWISDETCMDAPASRMRASVSGLRTTYASGAAHGRIGLCSYPPFRAMAWPAAMIVWEPGYRATAHRHHCIQLVMAIKGTLMIRSGRGDGWLKCGAALVRPDAVHEVDARNTTVLIAFIDAESDLGSALNERIKSDIFSRFLGVNLPAGA